MPMNRFLLVAWVSLALTVAGRTAAPAAPAPAAPAPAATPRTEIPAALSDEDLKKIVDETAKDVEALRGWKFKAPVKTAFTDEDGLRQYVLKRFEQQYPGERFLAIQAFLRMVGLVAADCDIKEAFLGAVLPQTLGFYDPDTRALYLLKGKGRDYGPSVARIIVAHELTHALDDQQFDAKKFINLSVRTEDQELALWSVIEGSATNLMTRYTQAAEASGRVDAREVLRYSLRQNRDARRLLADAPPYFAVVLGVYSCGMNFLLRGDFLAGAMGQGKNVAEELLLVAKEPPRSSEQILHPEKYWEASRRDEPVLVDDAALARLLAAPGRHVVHTDTVGEMLAAVLVRPKGEDLDPLLAAMPGYWTADAAAGWGGDRFYLLAAGTDRAAAAKALHGLQGAWITLWDTPKDRDEFTAACDKRRTGAGPVAAKVGNLGAAFFYGFSAEAAAALAKRLESSPPPLTRGGKKWSFWAP
jgi:hypothetical protein